MSSETHDRAGAPSRRRLVVTELAPEHDEVAIRLLSDRFLDDPVWLAIGPSRARHRRKVLNLYHRGELAVARRWGGPILGALLGDELVGVLVAFGPGRYPPPPVAAAYDVPALLLAGPAPIVRAFRIYATLHRMHPKERHAYAWLLAAKPGAVGVGRILLKRLIEHGLAEGAPVYAETMRPENLPFFRQLGFAITAKPELVAQTPWWALRRPV